MRRPLRLFLPAAALLGLTACNQPGHMAQENFNAAGQNLGHGDIGSGANDIGHGFSNGANATGQAIVSTAHQVGDAFKN
jgi:hypothetical protein